MLNPTMPTTLAPLNLHRLPDYGCVIASMLAVVLFVAALVERLGKPMHGEHSFREAQTALVARQIQQGGLDSMVSYPGLCPPWTLAFELPVYQALVATVASLTGYDIPDAGRWVSGLLHLAAVAMLSATAVLCGMHWRVAALTAVLLILSPLSVRWSTTILIESTAVAAGAAMLVFFALAHRSKRMALVWLTASAVCGALLSAIKITTAPGFLLLLPLITIHASPQRFVTGSPFTCLRHPRNVAMLTVVGMAAVASGLLWTHFADSVKEGSPFGQYLVSDSVYMRAWNIGVVAMRFQESFWHHIAISLLEGNGGGIALHALVVCGVVGMIRTRVSVPCLMLMAALAGPLLFSPLYAEHSYYFAAINPIAIFALGSACAFFIASFQGKQRTVAAGVTATFAIWAAVSAYVTPTDTGSRFSFIINAAMEAAEETSPDTILVTTGFDWHPAFPYYAERRCIMVPEWPYLDNKNIATAIAMADAPLKLVTASLDEERNATVMRLVEQAAASRLHTTTTD